MLIECDKCSKRYEIKDPNKETKIKCKCGDAMVVHPWLSNKKIITSGKEIRCPLCRRKHKLNEYRNNTEVACNCGNLYVVKSFSNPRIRSGRRESDHSAELLEVELQGLINTSRLIHSSDQDLNKLIPLVIKIATDILRGEGSSVVLRDKETGGLIFKYAVSGIHDHDVKSFKTMGSIGIVSDCVENQKAIILNNLNKYRRISIKKGKKVSFVTRSIICVPLVVNDDCIGALAIINKRNNENFNKHDLALSEAVSNQIAIAIYNAELAQEALKTERLAAIGQAIAGVVHCINNLLTGLNCGVHVLKSVVAKTNVKTPGRSIEHLENNLEQLKHLVQDMLTYSKKREPEYKQVYLNDLVKSVVDLMQPRANESNVKLRFFSEPGLLNAEVDPKAIYRSVLNLVLNAMDASRKDSVINISVRSNDAQEAVIEVSDHGCGMDEKTVRSMFQAFFSTKGSSGTGLGLSVTHKIVNEHGGRIKVKTAPNKGTTFKIYLPKRKPKIQYKTVKPRTPALN
ncbi:ATP-binding protein [Elusimicrobiota bacterium]